MKSTFEKGMGYGTLAAAASRVVGFFALILILTPVQLLYATKKREKPFLVTQLFHRLILRLLGFHVRTHGRVAAPGPVLYVANHASYLDIPVLSTLIPAAFVAKSDVRDWPMIGWLAEKQHTVFVERRAARADKQRHELQERLLQGQSLVLFPEGTSSPGLTALPFKSSLFSTVENMPDGQNVTVQPVSIVCTRLDGMPMTRALRHHYAWYGDMTFMRHLWNVFKVGRFTVDVIFHAPVTLADFGDRKLLAAYCQQQVAAGVEQCVIGRGTEVNTLSKLPAPPPTKRLTSKA